MGVAFDPAKDERNFEKHGLRLSDYQSFDADPTVVEDRRREYGESRFRAFGRINGLGHCLVYVVRDTGMRLISFRRARDKEMRRYE